MEFVAAKCLVYRKAMILKLTVTLKKLRLGVLLRNLRIDVIADVDNKT